MPSDKRPRVMLSWSSGKDSSWSLHVLRQDEEIEVAGLLTTVTEKYARVSMHAVREELLDDQADALGLPVTKIYIPSPCPNDIYEAKMTEAIRQAKAEGVTTMAFGDLFLQDVRAYREENLADTGIAPVFPIWGMDTSELALEMVKSGLKAVVTCVDPRQLDPSFAGRQYDEVFLADLPTEVDPCGENGEFHTFAYDGPMFGRPVPVQAGEVVERDGFVFADVLPG